MVSSRLCSPGPKCVSPTETKASTASASKIPSSSTKIIEDNTKGRKLLHFKEDNKVNRQEYTFQEVVDYVAVKAIVTAIDAQYVEELDEDYVGYKNNTIKTMIAQLKKWYIITTKEKVVIKAHFLDPWSDTLNSHITTFARQLEMRQVECKYNEVTVIEADKVDHFVYQMYAFNLFDAKLLDDWNESNGKSWGAIQTHFTKQYDKEQRKLERNKSHKNY